MKNKVLKTLDTLLNSVGNITITIFSWLWWLLKKTFQLILVLLRYLLQAINWLLSPLTNWLAKTRVGKLIKKTGRFFSNKKFRRYRLPAQVVMVVLLVAIAYLGLRDARQTEAAWFDEGWLYRKKVAITNSGSAQTNTQVKILTNTDLSTLVSAGKLQSNLDDLRFTDANGKALLYWIEDSTSSSVDVWALIPSVPASSSTIYMYYGNSAASAGKSITGTSEFPGISCQAIKLSGATTDEIYYIDPNGEEISDAYQAYCDLNTKGGGWTMLWKNFGGPRYSNYSGQLANSTLWATSTSNLVAPFSYTSEIASQKNVQAWNDFVNKTGVDLIKISQSYDASEQLYVSGNHTYDVRLDLGANVSINDVYTTSACAVLNNQVEMFINGVSYGATNYTGETNSASSIGFANNGATTDDCGQAAGNLMDGWNARHVISYNHTTASRDTVRCQFECWGTTDVVQEVVWGIREDAVTITSNISAGSPAAEEITPGPVAYWKFDEGYGVVAQNSAWQKSGTTTNSITNPSFEIDTSSWSNQASSMTRDISTMIFGNASVAVNTGRVYITAPVSAGEYITMTAWAKTSTASSARIHNEFYGGDYNWQGTFSSYHTGGGGWERVSLRFPTSGTATSNTTGYFFLYSSSGTSYFDGIQVEKNTPATSYCDGSLTGNGSHAWNGTTHASTSACEYGNDGDINGPTWQSADQCISGKCLSFNGTSDYVVSPDALPDSPAEGAASVWFRRTWATNDSITHGLFSIGEYDSGQHVDYKRLQMFKYSGNNLWYFRIADETSMNQVTKADSEISANEWHHVVMSWTGGTTTVYLDGSSIGSFNQAAPSSWLNDKVNIGRAYSNGMFKGNIDEVKIYPKARSARQIKADYNAGKSGASSSQGSTAAFGANSTGGVLSDGLVGYWKMDEASANTCSGGVNDSCDSSGNGNDGAWGGTNTSGSGKFGNSGLFAASGYISMGNVSSLNMGTGDMTISVWAKRPDNGLSQELVNKGPLGSGDIGDSYTLYIQSTGIFKSMFAVSGSNALFNGNAVVDNDEWHHLVAVFDRDGNLSNYIDGNLDSSTSISDYNGVDLSNSNNFLIGGARAYTGSIDEVRIYNRALSPGEVQKLYNWAPGPVGHWMMDENTGTTANDSSGNNNPGTLTNSPSWSEGKYGGGIKLSTDNRYVDVPTLTPNITNNSLTIEGWINIGLSGVQRLFSQSSGYPALGFTGTTMFVHTLTSSGTDLNSPYTTMPANCQSGWHHIAITWDTSLASNNVKVYCDGTQFTSSTLVNALNGSFNISNFRVGYYTGSQSINGTIDDVRIYNYARTPGQIIQDMNAGHPIGGSPVGSQVAYWRFDEGYGTTANDQVGNNDATITSATWTNNGKSGKALSFDGSDDYIMANLIPSITKSGTYTISTWIYKTDSTIGAIVQNSNSGTDRNGLVVNNTTVQFGYYDGAWHGKSGTINLNEWVHLAGVNDGGSLKLYINGEEQGGTSNPYVSSGGALYIGKVDIDDRAMFSGLIDEVKIYSTALTADEILIDMNQGASSVMGVAGTDSSGNADSSADRSYCPPGDTTANCAPIAEWNFEENTGTTARDTSGNGHNSSSFNGSPTWALGKEGAALDFEADNNDWVVVTDHNDLDMATNDFTACLWINPETTGGQYDSPLDHREDAGTNLGYQFRWGASNEMQFLTDYGASSQQSVGTALSTNTWYYFCAVVDRDGYQYLYQDGQLVDSDSISAYSAVNISHTDNLLIGSTGSTSYDFDGKIDQVRIYDYARTPAQIAYDYNRGAPVGYWRLDECQGTTAYDSSGNGNNGTITIGASGSNTSAGTCAGSAGQAWYDGATGKRNASLEFDGTDDYVNVADPTGGELDFSTNDFTISAWIKANSFGSYNRVVSKYNNETSGEKGYILSINSQKLTLYAGYGGANATSTASLNTGQWYHVIGIRSGNNVYLYINGIQDGSGSGTSANVASSSVAMRIGSEPSGNYYFSGQIDEVQIYNYALTAQQIKNLYNESAVHFGPSTGSP